jgi:hypothetical protein
MFWKQRNTEVPKSVKDAQLSGNHYFYNPDGSPPVKLTPQAVMSALTIRGQNRTINNMHAERSMYGGTGY